MKKILALFAILVFIKVSAQDPVTIHFRNGEKLRGLAKIKSNGDIIIKKNNKKTNKIKKLFDILNQELKLESVTLSSKKITFKKTVIIKDFTVKPISKELYQTNLIFKFLNHN